MDITAVILAGGKGTRMNNADKAWVDYRGEPLINHVLKSVQGSATEIIISYNRSEHKYASLPYRCYRDLDAGYPGPLSGVVSCAPHISTEGTLVLPCDMPRLPGNLVQTLAKQLGDHDLAVAHDGTRLQPLVFLARTEILLPSITRYMKDGNRSVTGWCLGQNHTIVRFDQGQDAFLNINDVTQLE